LNTEEFYGRRLLAALLCVLVAAAANVAAVSLSLRDTAAPVNGTAASKLLDPSARDAADVAAYLMSMRESLTQEDFLAQPFDLSNSEDALMFDALTHKKTEFQAWRENIARTAYHMELNDYEALFDKHRSSLLDLASSLNVPVTLHATSFDALLRKIDAEVFQRERRSPKGAVSSFVEARVAIAALHESSHLFRSRTTLHSLLVQDALVFGIGSQIGEMIDWTVKKVQQYKCTWCKAVLNFMKTKACEAAGTAMCTLLVGAMSGPLSVVASRFLCKFPLYLGKLFGSWCTQGVTWIMAKAGLTDECLCGFRIPSFSIPATEFEVMGMSVFKSSKKTIAIGPICPTKPGQCIGSTEKEKETYKANKAAEAAEKAKLADAEAARVKKMSTQEKIAYHTKIIKGEIKTNMSDAMVAEILTSATGLGKSLIKSLAKGGKELLKGNVKGAATAVAKSVAADVVKGAGKKVAESVTKAAAKKIVEKTVSTATKVAINGVTRTVINRVDAGAREVADKTAELVGKGTHAVTTAAGKTATNIAAATVGVVTGSKEKADAVRAEGDKLTKAAANIAAEQARATTSMAGHLVLDVAKNSATHVSNAKIAKKVSGIAAHRVNGKLFYNKGWDGKTEAGAGAAKQPSTNVGKAEAPSPSTPSTTDTDAVAGKTAAPAKAAAAPAKQPAAPAKQAAAGKAEAKTKIQKIADSAKKTAGDVAKKMAEEAAKPGIKHQMELIGDKLTTLSAEDILQTNHHMKHKNSTATVKPVVATAKLF